MYNFKITLNHQKVILNQTVNTDVLFKNFTDQYLTPVISQTIGNAYGAPLWYQLTYMMLSLGVLSLGVSMYQLGNMGLAPYDYLSVGLTDHYKGRYFYYRMLTDGFCCTMVILMVYFSLVGFRECHLGIGTVMSALCLGPFINLFNRLNLHWIR